MKKSQINRLAEEAQNLLIHLENYKKIYSRLDEITNRLIGQDLSKTGITLIDNFEEKNTAWKSVAARRYEIKRTAEAGFKIRRA